MSNLHYTLQIITMHISNNRLVNIVFTCLLLKSTKESKRFYYGIFILQVIYMEAYSKGTIQGHKL